MSTRSLWLMVACSALVSGMFIYMLVRVMRLETRLDRARDRIEWRYAPER